MKLLSSRLARLLVVISSALFLPPALADECAYRMLVSGYYSNVHIYDACTGAFLRMLDTTSGRIAGPQAVKRGPDNLLWVVSEEAGKILRYRPDTFEYVDTFAQLPPNWGATGIAFIGDDDVYISSYSTSAVRKYSLASKLVVGEFPAATATLKGPDNGMMAGPDGQLYIPGYDTSNIVRFDPGSRSYATWVAPAANGIRKSRGLLLSADGSAMYLTSERSGHVLRYRFPSGQFDKTIASGLDTPTGIAWHPDGSLLIAIGGQGTASVVKLDPETGAIRGTLVSNSSGGLSAPTYIAVLSAGGSVTTPDAATIGSQYWVTGLATMSGNRLDIDNVYASLGTSFGATFNPAEVRVLPWGKIRMQFISCTEADFSWESTGAGTANFGNGSYRMIRILRNQATAECERTGVATAPNKLWLAGSWYGGESRSGEGLMLDTDAAGMVFLTWFTHRPRTP
ncbi:hypothetical protein [Tahibacter amnicola]|uniref:SMP-30/gluconolaconase/LRE-like protein n=1 Tax=Tahibacter amnicola TaxID=2976241 RepID=A0ABY6BBJ0_9GAMM|nr:hypothetical protein [Tahibacter amnicola]UXI67172.1 hypothetical protein N4264_20880 [Tahibacter amnicola]